MMTPISTLSITPPTNTSGTIADCLFCKIIRGEIPAKVVFQSETVSVFEDIAPQAPVHLLIIANTHTPSHLETDDDTLYQHLMTTAKTVAKALGLTDYRLIMNNGAGAGQSVFHMHLHLLAGRSLHWPPG
jgi:histidine triad (HIT) family protein